MLKKFFITLIKLYQWLPFRRLSSCIYTPTCSEYTLQAIEKYGALRGVGMGIKRIGRCHPFAEGGYDPVEKVEEDNNQVINK